MASKCRPPRRATISVEVEMPRGITVRALRRRGAIRVITATTGEPVVLPVVQINGVAQAGN